MSFVTVIGDANHNVINISANPEFGFIRVRQETIKIGKNGWLRFENRTALVHGTLKDLMKVGYSENDQIPGKIVIKESFTPFDKNNPDYSLKIAGKTGIILKVDDQPIYRKTIYTTDLADTDELIQHDQECRQEIQDVMAAQRAMDELSSMENVTL